MSVAMDQLNEGVLQDIGQVTNEDRKILRKLRRKGLIAVTREPWLGMLYPLKTTYRPIKL